jgi:hypothetical protein
MILLLAVFACRKESGKTPPLILMETGSGFIEDSSVVAIGYPCRIGIRCQQGDAPITNLVLTLETENGKETALDSGMYSSGFLYEKTLAYGASDFERWTFMIRDKNGKSDTVMLTIRRNLSSAFGPIAEYSSVDLGAQGSLLPGSFFSVADGMVYTSAEAGDHQQDINLITYWGDQVSPVTNFTLSSPGESDVTAYFPMIGGWVQPYNETRYKPDSLSIPVSAFEAAFNDSLIITNYTSATIGKRKFKSARPGYIIPFQVTTGPAAGKRGLIRVNSMEEGINGRINVDIKVQK